MKFLISITICICALFHASAFGMEALLQKQQDVALRNKISALIKQEADKSVLWANQLLNPEYDGIKYIMRMSTFGYDDFKTALDAARNATKEINAILALHENLKDIIAAERKNAERNAYIKEIKDRTGVGSYQYGGQIVWDLPVTAKRQDEWQQLYQSIVAREKSGLVSYQKSIILYLKDLNTILQFIKNSENYPYNWQHKKNFDEYMKQDPIFQEIEKFVKTMRGYCKFIAINLGEKAFNNYKATQQYKDLLVALGEENLTPIERFIKNYKSSIQTLAQANYRKLKAAYDGRCDQLDSLGQAITKEENSLKDAAQSEEYNIKNDIMQKTAFKDAYWESFNALYDKAIFIECENELQRNIAQTAISLKEALEKTQDYYQQKHWADLYQKFIPHLRDALTKIATKIDSLKVDNTCLKIAIQHADALTAALQRAANNIAGKAIVGVEKLNWYGRANMRPERPEFITPEMYQMREARALEEGMVDLKADIIIAEDAANKAYQAWQKADKAFLNRPDQEEVDALKKKYEILNKEAETLNGWWKSRGYDAVDIPAEDKLAYNMQVTSAVKEKLQKRKQQQKR